MPASALRPTGATERGDDIDASSLSLAAAGVHKLPPSIPVLLLLTRESDESSSPSFAPDEATKLGECSGVLLGDAKVEGEETKRLRLSRSGEDGNSSSSSCWYKRTK
jgi:hypothetical protein